VRTGRRQARRASAAAGRPIPPASRHPSRIALISFLILVLELALIRFIPSEIKAISYFTNLLLFSAFFGLGLGCILWKREVSPYLFAAGLMLIFAFVMVSRGITVYETPGEVHYWLQADQRFKPFYRMPLVAAAFTVFSVSAVPFVTMGRTLAREMQGHPRLTAYSYDLIGSFAGTIVFALFSYCGTPPWILIALTGVTWALTMCESVKVRLAHVVAALAFLCFVMAPYSWRWSPYYFVQYLVDAKRITVWVNSSFHQEAINFQSEQPEFQPTALRMAEKFGLPYREYRRFHDGRAPEKILILGAGTGNDVNIALRNGARDITAVEIDPQIAAIGREFNPMRPYQDAAVRLFIDDGRHFLSNAKDRYDMVVFGTLDSQTLLAGQTNLRLDNYIYTTECFTDARKVLEPGGMLAAYYSVFKPWFLGRIYATVASAFPGALQMHRLQDNYLFNTTIIAAKDVPAFASDPETDRQFKAAIPSTDNWPYIYLEYPVISNLYLQVLGLIGALIALVVVVLRKLEKSAQYHLDFFFLGVGFSLMESAAIVRLALAFGSTWVVSAVVFACVLLTVFVANVLLERWPSLPAGLAWAALLAALAINFLFPVQTLLGFSFPLRVVGSAALIGTPVFCAGISFSSLFRREPEVGVPFGMNMVGAMTGGSIEYLSMLIGMKSIWLVLVIVYLLAFLCNRFKGR
jgi:predicted membrane-bound spermidine synthase